MTSAGPAAVITPIAYNGAGRCVALQKVTEFEITASGANFPGLSESMRMISACFDKVAETRQDE